MKSDPLKKSEAAEAPEVKKSRSNMRFAVLLVLWLMINMVWATLHQQPSLNQVNIPDHPLRENHTLDMPDIIGVGRPVPMELRCVFEIKDQASQVVQAEDVVVTVNLTRTSGTVIHSWQGTVADDCPSWNGELVPGEYRLHTSIVGDSKQVDSMVEYDIFVLENLALEGFIIANILGGMLALTEVPARRKERKQRQQKVKGGWKPKAWDVGAATREVDVDEFHDPLEDGDSHVSEDVAAQREKYQQEIEKSRLVEPEPEPMFAAQPVEQPDELDDGELRGLEGRLKSDERIKTVSDIYDLMED